MDAQMKKDFIKGGAFLIENRTANEIFTPEDLTEEQIMIGETTRDFVDNEVRSESRSDGKSRLGIGAAICSQSGRTRTFGREYSRRIRRFGSRSNDRRRHRGKYGTRFGFGVTFGAQTSIGLVADSLFRFGFIERKIYSAHCRGRKSHGLLPVGIGFGFGRFGREMQREIKRRRQRIYFERRKNVDFQRRFCRCFYCFCQS